MRLEAAVLSDEGSGFAEYSVNGMALDMPFTIGAGAISQASKVDRVK